MTPKQTDSANTLIDKIKRLHINNNSCKVQKCIPKNGRIPRIVLHLVDDGKITRISRLQKSLSDSEIDKRVKLVARNNSTEAIIKALPICGTSPTFKRK